MGGYSRYGTVRHEHAILNRDDRLPELRRGSVVKVTLDNRRLTFVNGKDQCTITLPVNPCYAKYCHFGLSLRAAQNLRADGGTEALPKLPSDTRGYCATCECTGEVKQYGYISLGVGLGCGTKVTLLP